MMMKTCKVAVKIAACAALWLPLPGAPSLAEEPAAPAAGVPIEPSDVGNGPPLIRRLTESQYRATIADIFGADIPIVGRFEHGLRADGLLAVGTSQAGLSTFSFEQYDASAQGVAAAVVNEAHRGKLVPCEAHADNSFDAPCAKQFVQHEPHVAQGWGIRQHYGSPFPTRLKGLQLATGARTAGHRSSRHPATRPGKWAVAWRL